MAFQSVDLRAAADFLLVLYSYSRYMQHARGYRYLGEGAPQSGHPA